MKKIIELNRLIEFYQNAYFPMADSELSEEIKFYKPKLRFIIPISNFEYPKKLFNDFKKTKYVFKINSNFSKVIKFCKEVKRKDKDTWINNIIVDTFIELHKVGKSHSVECYEMKANWWFIRSTGSCFGESMFSLKIILVSFCLIFVILKNKFTSRLTVLTTSCSIWSIW